MVARIGQKPTYLPVPVEQKLSRCNAKVSCRVFRFKVLLKTRQLTINNAKMRPKGPSESEEVKWDAKCKELKRYHKKHGHSNVPSTLKNKLSHWVINQRADHRNKEVRMTAERIARLDKLDFRWPKRLKVAANNQKNDERWLKMYNKLKKYHEKHGHSKVPQRVNAEPDQIVLSAWVSGQRVHRNRMPQSRKDLLDELDFLWIADNWDARYKQLLKFRQEHGHCNVPDVAGNRSNLGVWCRKQLDIMRQNKLPPERRGRMEEIGFHFRLQSEKKERKWTEKFQRLKKCKLKSEDNDDRKPPAKRRRTTSTEAAEEYEEEAVISKSPLGRYSVVTKVKKFFEGHGWFLGEIVSIFEDGCNVRYEDGDEETYLLHELDDLDKIIANVSSSGT
jgi:hypothetical protein